MIKPRVVFSVTSNMGKGDGWRSYLEEEWVFADPLNWGQQVALQRDVRGLPASQKHAALQRNRRPTFINTHQGQQRDGATLNNHGK